MATQNKYIRIVSDMSTDQLDDWYMEHVGYRLTEDDPSFVGSLQHCAQVAEMMCLHEHGEGPEYDALLAELQEEGFYNRFSDYR